MRTTYGISALALTAALAIAPIAAKADLTLTQTASIAAAVDAAMQTGQTSALQTLLTQLTTANPNDAGAITDVVAQEITKDAASSSTTTVIAGTETTIAEAVTNSAIIAIVAAAPGQAGTVLAEAQANLSSDLTVAAVTATQTALAPAAGGSNAQLRNDIKTLVADFKALLTAIIQTAEQARRSTASPS